jgi:hypothetical protein
MINIPYILIAVQLGNILGLICTHRILNNMFDMNADTLHVE